jgi:DNA-binding NarL/FixJ family response regulator
LKYQIPLSIVLFFIATSPSFMRTKVLLFEDNDLLRESISALVALHGDWELSGAFPDANAALDQIAKHRPDVLLMDIEMPGVSGIEATKAIRKVYPQLPILILTVFDDPENVLQAIKAGASGYLLKKHIASRLNEAVEEVLDGGAPMSPAVAKMVLASMQKVNAGKQYDLTPREKEILQSLSRGNSFKMIASEFSISIDTVRSHIKNIYDKLNVHSQTEAVSKAINEGLV